MIHWSPYIYLHIFTWFWLRISSVASSFSRPAGIFVMELAERLTWLYPQNCLFLALFFWNWTGKDEKYLFINTWEINKVELLQAKQGHWEAGQLVVVQVDLPEGKKSIFNKDSADKSWFSQQRFGHSSWPASACWGPGGFNQRIRAGNEDTRLSMKFYLRFFSCCSDIGIDWIRLNDRFRFSSLVSLPVS